MKKLFLDTRVLDKSAKEKYFLSEDLMMENAASALEKEVKFYLEKSSPFCIQRASVLILCGKGNNGGDGYALARRLMKEKLSVTVCSFDEPVSDISILQKKRAQSIGVNFIEPYDLDFFFEEKSVDLKIVVDCIFGSGFHGSLPPLISAVIKEINLMDDIFRISCDVPTGLDLYGNSGGEVFNAHSTVCMGALKYSLYSDFAKDYVGKIVLCDLGISQENFETESEFLPDAFLLEEKDVTLPYRNKENVYKNKFGHGIVISGEKEGASVIAGIAALKFGCGLVTLLESKSHIPYELMSSDNIPENTNAIALGMGLGRNNPLGKKYINYLKDNMHVSCVLDADIFYEEEIVELLKTRSENKSPSVIITPHPKEFSSLLSLCGIGDFSVKEIIERKYELVKLFCEKYPSIILILKGANPIIACKLLGEEIRIYINEFGTCALAKAGSGDVLSGLCLSLLAQNYNGLKAAVTASVYHGKGAREFKNNFSLNPFDLIEKISNIKD